MAISDAQLGRIVAHALPGAGLRAAEPLGERTLRLDLREGRPVVLRLGADPDPGAGAPLAAEAAALRALRAEIDLPLPELLACDPAGEAGEPYLLTSYLEGMALPEALPALPEEQLYAVGRDLGALLARVHAYIAPAYGPLDPAAPPELAREPASGGAEDPGASGGALPRWGASGASGEDARYLRARLDAAAVAALAAGELDTAGAARLGAWADSNLAGTGRPACLVHGDLRPARVLVRRRERGWAVAGLAGWGFAQAWRPAWDHVALVEHFAGDAYFGLRVGYGNAYDETTGRTYDQLREFALAPFRLVLFLEAGRADLALALLRQGDAL